MDRDTAAGAGISHLMRLQTSNYPSNFPAPSLSPSFKLDEGYSDETRSQPDNDPKPSSDDAMTLPDWLLAHSESDRAELAYRLLRTLRTSSVAAVVDRLTPLLHMDPVLKLPPEITSEIFSYLDPRSLLTASLASRAWRCRIFDSRLWRELYIHEGWRVDIDAIRTFEQEHSEPSSPQTRKTKTRHTDTDAVEPKLKKRVPPSWFDSRSTGSRSDNVDLTGREGLSNAETSTLPDNEGDHHMTDASNDRLVSTSLDQPSSADATRDSRTAFALSKPSTHPLQSSLLIRLSHGTAKINWPHLYKQRRRLEENWIKGQFTNFQIPHPSHPEEGHQECVYAFQFIGRWLVSGSRDRTVRVWDLNTMRLWHRPLLGHTKSVLCLQFDPSPSEDVIISGSSDKGVIVWRFSTGEMIQHIPSAHDDSVLNLRFNKRYLVTCSKDKLVKVWNRQELAPTDSDYPTVYKGAGVTYPSYIIDTSDIPSAVLEAGIANGHIKSLAPYSLLMTLEGHAAAINAIQINEDEIVSASGDRLIKIWNIRNGACKKTIMGHEKGIACVELNNRRIISGSNDNTVRIFDHSSGAEVACLHGHHNLVRTVQAGFGDPPGAEEAMRLEALTIDNEYWDAKRSGALVDLTPSAMRRAGYSQNTTGSRNPRDIRTLGAKIPPGGGGSRWGRIVSGSYDESVIIWKKDREGKWVISQRLRQADAAANANRGHSTRARVAIAPQQVQQAHQVQALQTQLVLQIAQGHGAPANGNQQAAMNNTAPLPQNQPHPPPQAGVNGQAANGPAGLNQPHAHHHHHIHLPAVQPTSRIFKLQFDARKIICASQDYRLVGWDFACDDEEIIEACQFFKGL